jgi:hypothetical protein
VLSEVSLSLLSVAVAGVAVAAGPGARCRRRCVFRWRRGIALTVDNYLTRLASSISRVSYRGRRTDESKCSGCPQD